MSDLNDLPCMQFVLESLANVSIGSKADSVVPKGGDQTASKKSSKKSKSKPSTRIPSTLHTNIVQSISSSSNPLADIAALAMEGLSEPTTEPDEVPSTLITELNVANREAKPSDEFVVPDDCVDLVEMLLPMFPDFSPELCVYALQKCNKNIEDTVDYLLTNENVVEEFRTYRGKQVEQEKKEKETDEAIKKIVLARYDDGLNGIKVPVTPYPLVSKEKKGEKVLRYVDGQPVWLNASEKFIVEKQPEDPSTMVSIKIKRKGQGGPSPGFSK